MLGARRRSRRIVSRPHACAGLLAVLAGAVGIASVALADDAERRTLAVAEFDLTDASGEIRDRTARREAGLEALAAALRDGLSEEPWVEPIALACAPEACTATNPGLDVLMGEARTAGARYLLVGAVHEISPEIGQVRFAILDLDDEKPVCDRLLSYGGDTEEMWRQAAEFAVGEIKTHCLS